jgi:hypothetical protein
MWGEPDVVKVREGGPSQCWPGRTQNSGISASLETPVGAPSARINQQPLTCLVTVMKSLPKNTPVTPSTANRRLARGEAMAARADENSWLPDCTAGWRVGGQLGRAQH